MYLKEMRQKLHCHILQIIGESYIVLHHSLNKTGETWILKDRRGPTSNHAIRLLTFPKTACFMHDCWRISNFGLDALNEFSSENLPRSCFWNTAYKCYPPQSFKRCDLKKKRNLLVKHFLIWLVKNGKWSITANIETKTCSLEFSPSSWTIV